jgi:hypothetical protein
MLAPLTSVIVAIALGLVGLTAWLAIADRACGRAVWVLAIGLEGLLAAQGAVGVVLGARTERPLAGWVFGGYLLGSLFVVPAAWLWAKVEPGRWGAGVMVVAGLVIAVLEARLGQIWGGE